MLRTLHSIPALIASLLLVLVALTGSALSVFPALERRVRPTRAIVR